MSLFVPSARLRWGSTLAEGLVFYHNGSHPGTEYYHDSSLFDNHGELKNMDPDTDWVPDARIGWALDFAGDDDYIDLGVVNSALDAKGDFTASMWFRSDDITQAKFLLYLTDGLNDDYLMIGTLNSKILASGDNTDGASAVSGALQSGVLYHLAVTKTALDVTGIYIEGVDVTAVAGENWSGNNAHHLIAETYYDGSLPNFPWDGVIGNIVLHSRILTPSEIQLLYTRPNAQVTPRQEVFAAAVAAAAGGPFPFYTRRRMHGGMIGMGG